ncbi:WavE lipopolysaccharide synthesis family protein [Burkholderia cenocepacia]|uniref:WavE lipopolysaccharide synthesis family protein n=1 Tax=Burkholderia cenocepacia TaxID=95486 RepID=UPI0028B6EBE8|nr:WavE lipopolysaccharide synthesis family protein [Burkholderia cenocepacia]MDT6992282.1 WavE lipopolysaccharide synthesis family protein [Burkholderia cenocepacia]
MTSTEKGARNLAVVLTGVPRGYERCVDTLKFILDEWSVSYFAVIREEFASEETLRSLARAFPGVKAIVVPKQATVDAVSRFEGKPIAATLVMMWHEIAYGIRAIERLTDYQAVLRVRFDIYFQKQFLPEEIPSEGQVLLPTQMSWSGVNDMLCLAVPPAFRRYAETYERLDDIVAEGICVPEAIMARSLAMVDLTVRPLNVGFILYRDALFASFNDEDLRILADVHPSLSTYKVGDASDTQENRAERIGLLNYVVGPYRGFPLQTGASTDANFYPVEIDSRDGSAFRWIGRHAHMNLAVPRDAKTLSFLIHFQVAGWHLSQLTVLIDGFPVRLIERSVDQYGRVWVEGSIAGNKFNRPWSKLGFSSRIVVDPSQEGAGSDENRTLSVAIGSLSLDGQPLVEPDALHRRPMAAQADEKKPAFIADNQITIVFQGPWNDRLHENVALARECFPGAPIVIGSSDVRMHEAFPVTEDVILAIVPDPGPLPPYVRGEHAPPNNVNRLIVSSQAGLALVTSPYAIKIRTDCTLDSRAFVDLYERIATSGAASELLLTSSMYTLHPDGIEGFPFHVSDWFFFGPSDVLRKYFDVPLMTKQDAVWYDNVPHDRGSHYFARRYRSRFSPEQYLAVQNALKDSYVAPRFLDDSRPEVVESYRRYLANRFIVCDVSRFGLVFDKYRRVPSSHYQYFNCVWGSDWRFMVEPSRRAAFVDVDLGPSGPAPNHRRQVVSVVRRIDHVLGVVKKCGLMPLLGDILGIFRRFNSRGKNIC